MKITNFLFVLKNSIIYYLHYKIRYIPELNFTLKGFENMFLITPMILPFFLNNKCYVITLKNI